MPTKFETVVRTSPSRRTGSRHGMRIARRVLLRALARGLIRRLPPRVSIGLRLSRRLVLRNLSRLGSFASAEAVRSRSQEPMTLPRRQTSATSGMLTSYLYASGSRRGAVSASLSRFCIPALACLIDVQAFCVGGHDAVLDAVVDHLDEVPCA